MAHVVTPIDINGTVHASKQALYNRIFKAQNYTRYTPNYTESKFELLVAYNVHVAITRYRLKRIGNTNALDLLNNINHTVSLEDLQQEILLKFVELADNWNIDFDGTVTFNDDDTTIIEVFKAVDNYLYRFQTKHYKHQYIEIDGDIVDANKVTELADYVSIDNIIANEHFFTFYNQQATLDKQWIDCRLQGLSNSKIAVAMGVTYEKIRAIEKRVRRNWTAYNN